MASSSTEEERVVGYFRIRKIESTEQQNVQPTVADFFRFEVSAITASTLFETSIRISCKRFFQHSEDFLQVHLLNNNNSWFWPYFTPEILVRISRMMIPKVQQLFNIQSHLASNNSGLEKPPREFPLALEIIVDVVEDNEEIMMEESMQQGVRMNNIPASNEAIQSLQTFALPQNCSICMEKMFRGSSEGDNNDDVKLSPLPCRHMFHHHCIVKWLRTSHVCPLCRYPMPTASN